MRLFEWFSNTVATSLYCKFWVVYQLLVPLGNKKITNAKGVQMSRLLNLISDHSNASVQCACPWIIQNDVIHLQQYLHSFCNTTFRRHCSKDNMSIVFCSSLWNNVILLQTHLSLAFSHDKLTSFLDLSVKVPHAERLIQTDPGAQIRQNIVMH